MERLIWMAWRAFWIGLGASVVLIVQALAPLAPKVTVTRVPAPPSVEAPAPPAAVPAPTQKSANPILSRNPFDSKTGALTKPAPRS